MRGVRWWVAIGLVIAAAVAGALGWRGLQAGGPAAQLAARIGEGRWTPGRSSLDLPYRPFGPSPAIDDFGEALAALYETGTRHAPEQPLAVANFLLWRGEPGDEKRALQILDGLESAAGWNERALVLLAKGREIRALDAVEQALALDPSLPAALFNRALLLERLLLAGEAAQAWERFLAREGAGPWADEARAHLAEVSRPRPVAPNLDEQTTELARALLALRGPEELEALVARSETTRLLGELEKLGDTLYANEIAWLRGLGDRWPERVAQASAYAANRARVLAGKLDRRALDRLRETDEPLLAVRYTHLAAFDAVQRVAIDDGRRYLAELERLCALHGCREESILVASDLGTLLSLQGEYQAAEAAFARALEEMPSGYLLRRSELLGKLSDVALRIGASDRAEGLLVEATRLAAAGGGDMTLGDTFINLARWTRQEGMPRVAAAYAREARALGLRGGSVRTAQPPGILLAELLQEDGRLEEAAALLVQLVEEGRASGYPQVAQESALALARVRLAQRQPDVALALARDVVREAREFELAEFLMAALELQGEAFVATGDRKAALAAFSDALAEAERQAAAAPSPLARQSMSRQEATLRMRLARLRFETGDVEGVWRALADERRPLAPDECLLAPLADGTGTFVATAVGTSFVAGALDGAIEGRDRCAAGTRRVVLLDRPTTASRQLSRTLRLSRADLAIVQAENPRAPWPDQPVSGTALVVHSPQPVVSDRPLPFLYGAQREAELVLSRFAGATELRGTDATPRRVAELAPGHGLIHFAVHGEARTGVGAASYLQLGGPEGRLQVVDILRLRLQQDHPVLVLSACNTGDAVAQAEHDGAGLPWAFLHAGARAVVAYQDALQDDVGLDFSRALYERLAAGEGLSHAFEQAVAAIRSSHGAQAAAAFVLII